MRVFSRQTYNKIDQFISNSKCITLNHIIIKNRKCNFKQLFKLKKKSRTRYGKIPSLVQAYLLSQLHTSISIYRPGVLNYSMANFQCTERLGDLPKVWQGHP